MTRAMIEAVFSTLGAVLCTAAFLPQALHIIWTRQTAGISLTAYLLLTIGALCWLVFGLMIMNWPIIAANAISGALLAVIVAMKLRYG